MSWVVPCAHCGASVEIGKHGLIAFCEACGKISEVVRTTSTTTTMIAPTLAVMEQPSYSATGKAIEDFQEKIDSLTKIAESMSRRSKWPKAERCKLTQEQRDISARLLGQVMEEDFQI